MRSQQSCVSIEDRAKYPYSETLVFFTEGSSSDLSSLTVDSEAVLVRKLCPVTALEVFTNRTEIYLRTIEFAGYDTAVSLLESPSHAAKDFANEQIIGNMLSATWQPNYFKPTVRVNDSELASNISTLNFSNISFSKIIGLPLPFCLSIDKLIKSPRSIDITASLAQQSSEGFRNYPVLAIVEFWHSGI